MKTNTGRKIIPAMLAVLLSLVIVSTATFAWFSMNREVAATGIDIKTTAPANTQISSDLVEWSNGTASATSEVFNYTPASTTNGKDFFALSNTQGLALSGGISSDGTDLNFKSVNGRMDGENTAYFFIMPLYIRATQEADINTLYMYLADFSINVSAAESASIYDQAKAQKLANSCRISVSQLSVAQSDLVVGADGLSGTGLVVADANSEKGFKLQSEKTFTESDAKIFKSDNTTVYPVESVGSSGAELAATDPAGKAVETISSPEEACFSLEPTGGVYSTIVIRIWIEGQHPDCLNEIAGQTISIDLTWQTYREAV
ncbi:MAG: hypothetical protein J6Y68_04700 [Clostridia bacterium]|nr:hypothetical protein [Clostridia bacterium]